MDANSGNFIPQEINEELEKTLGTKEKELFERVQAMPGGGLPTLAPYEIVPVKGVDFKVMRIYPFTGKLELEMVKKG